MQLLAGIGPLGLPELAIIAFIVVLVFGVGRLPEVGGAVGKGIREFRKASKDDDAGIGRRRRVAARVVERHRRTNPRRRPLRPADSVFCSECGGKNLREAKFCAHCGHGIDGHRQLSSTGQHNERRSCTGVFHFPRQDTQERTGSSMIRAVIFDLWDTLIYDDPEISELRSQLRLRSTHETLAAHGHAYELADIEAAFLAAGTELARIHEAERDISTRGRTVLYLRHLDRSLAERLDDARLATGWTKRS